MKESETGASLASFYSGEVQAMASCTALRVKVQVMVLTAELLRSQCGCYDGRLAPLGHGEGNAEMGAQINAIGGWCGQV